MKLQRLGEAMEFSDHSQLRKRPLFGRVGQQLHLVHVLVGSCLKCKFFCINVWIVIPGAEYSSKFVHFPKGKCSCVFFLLFILYSLEYRPPISQINTQKVILSYECQALAWIVFKQAFLKLNYSITSCLHVYIFLYSICLSLFLTSRLIV